jgi:hypothetical protein
MNNNLRQAVKLVVIGAMNFGVVVIAWTIDVLLGTGIALVSGGLWYAYFNDIEDKKQAAKKAAQQVDNFVTAVDRILPQIGADIMRGLLSEFGLPNNSQLPKLSHVQNNDGTTVYTLRFAKLPRKDRLIPEVLAALTTVLNSSVVSCLTNNAYESPFSEPYAFYDNWHVPCVYVKSVQDTGREIVINALLANDKINATAIYWEIYNAQYGGNTNNAPPPQPTDTNDTDF